MWTTENRGRYDRSQQRYPSDLTDEEWSHVAPLIPLAKHGGRKRKVDVREVVNGIMYVLSTGCQWRYVPIDLPPKSTLFDYFDLCQKKALPHLATEIVKRSDRAKGFEVLPKRWVVERTFAWLNRCRRLAKDFENLTRNGLAFLRLASIRLMLRKLCSNK